MRPITGAGMVAILSMLFFSPCKAAAVQSVQITEPFVNVYERLDPKSNVLETAAKGKRFDLLYAGPLWYQVKVRDQIGWVERKAGRVVEGTDVFSIVLSIVVICAVLAGTIYTVSLYIKKQKTA